MNRIEVFNVINYREIEETVNDYCRSNNLNPLSVSVAYNQRMDSWVVAVVVEEQDGAE